MCSLTLSCHIWESVGDCVDYLETMMSLSTIGGASSSKAGGWEDMVEVSNGVPSQKETGQSRAGFPLRPPMRN